MSLTSEAQAIILSGTLKAHSSVFGRDGEIVYDADDNSQCQFFNIHALSSYHDENGDDQHDHNDD